MDKENREKIPVFSDKVDEGGGAIKGQAKGNLRVMQCNTDSISTKQIALRDRLLKEDIDVCLVQETELKEKQNLEQMNGYNQYRADRKNVDGEGLLIIAKRL